MSDIPVIAIVGRPNVGKSTLFNVLTKTRAALVADESGVTRDRQYGMCDINDYNCILIDTGGISEGKTPLESLMMQQVDNALEEADIILFMVDARDGVQSYDREIADKIRSLNKPITLLVNKMDGVDEASLADFYAFGFEMLPIASSQRRGINAILEDITAKLKNKFTLPEPQAPQLHDAIKVAVIGRPNVGKSTLINRLLGEERLVVCDMPGTTTSAIDVPLERDGQKFLFIDTAGVRKRNRVIERVEIFSVIKTLKAIESAHVVILVIDARVGITDQDLSLIHQTERAGKGIIVGINKWDGLDNDTREDIKKALNFKLQFIPYAKVHFMSALHGTGVGHLYEFASKIYAQSLKDLTTNHLTELLETATQKHTPPIIRGRRIKLRYAHCGGHFPPLIIIHGNQTSSLPDSYKRYLSNFFREALKFEGVPVKLQFKSSDNPYKDKRNSLTPRQQHKRQRMMKHYKTVEKKKKQR